MKFNLDELWEKDIPEMISKYKEIVLIADGVRSCSDLNIVATLIENGYEMKLETYKGEYDNRAIKMTFIQK